MEQAQPTLAARYHSTGNPAEVIQVDAVPYDLPGPGQVRLQMLYAPINPADLNMLEGKYGEARPLPDVPGNEGAGRVIELGEGVTNLALGQIVLVDREAWRESGNWDVQHLIPVPEGLDPRNASMMRVNPPTAWRMLHDFVALQSGDWIVQNAATSGVGRAVIGIAKSRGWKTLCVVRRPESAEGLLALGADAVVVDDDEIAHEAKNALGGARPKLALNAVGGASATRLAGLLATGGTLVTYGAMSKEALKIPNGFLIFRDIRFRGFWLTRWLREAGDAQRREMFDEIFRLAAGGCFPPRVGSEFGLEDVKQALDAAASGSAGGKIILRLGV
jgi:NADPH:quinone reductase-like Zn-dependent oxidoreductase